MKVSVRFSRGLLIVLPIKNESRNGTSKAAVPNKTATSKRLSAVSHLPVESGRQK